MVPHPDVPAVAPPSQVTATVVAGGMPGWQITLIAVGAALLAATAAVYLDRAHRARDMTRAAPEPSTRGENDGYRVPWPGRHRHLHYAHVSAR